MIIQSEFQQLFEKMLAGGEDGNRAYKEYCVKRCQADQSQVDIDNSFLNFLAVQPNLNNCSFETLFIAAEIYGQKDGYAKPLKFIELLEISSNQPMPATHGAYLALPPAFRKENIITNIYEQSQRLAEKNNIEAQNNLGYIYTYDLGISPAELPQKDEKAVEWFRKAAMQGLAAAQTNLGVMYQQGQGIPAAELPQKDETAVEWYRKAAAQGLAKAQNNLGVMYQQGQGIPAAELPQKDETAVEWYRKAAVQGSAKAQTNLGVMYQQGRGISPAELPQKDQKAVEWYRKAAAQGSAKAQTNLGVMYQHGRGISPAELPQKDQKAVEWYRKAAVQGSAQAQNNLGLMYQHGRGILEDEKPDKVVMALFWYTKCSQQDPTINENLKKLKITTYQKKKAEMMLLRKLSYRQMKYLFEERALKYLLLVRILLKNSGDSSAQLKPLQSLPTDLLFKIAESLVPLSAEELKDLYNKAFKPLPDEITFKAKYTANSDVSIFFKNNAVVEKVKSGAPLLLTEVKKYAKEYSNSLEAKIYSQVKASP